MNTKSNPIPKYKCIRCGLPWFGNQKDGRKLGWKFHGRLQYCPTHKEFQFSLSDRDM